MQHFIPTTREQLAIAQKQLALLIQQLYIHKEQERRADQLLMLGFALTFLLYLAFALHLYLGDATTWKHYFVDWQASTGFVFMLTIASLMSLFLAWVKHHAYLHFGLYGSVTLIVVTVIGFALFAEFFSSSASQYAKSHVLLQSNAAYQQTLGFNPVVGISIAPATTSPALSADIAAATQKLVQCQANLGKPGYRHCDGDKGRLESLQRSQAESIKVAETAVQAQAKAQAEVATAAMQANHSRQDKLKADSYNPVIVMAAQLMGWFSGADYTQHIKAATVLVMLFVAVCFEILHHFLSNAKERASNAVMALELEVAKFEAMLTDGNLTVPNLQAAPPADKDGGFQSNGIGFTAPIGTTAKLDDTVSSSTRFKWQRATTSPRAKLDGFGLIPNRSTATSIATSPPPPADSTYRQELRSGSQQYRDVPLDTATRPLANGTDGAAAKNPQQTVSTPLANRTKADGLYGEWVQAVLAGECLPSVKPTWLWIQKRISAKETGSKTNDRTRISSMQRAFFGRAIREGLMLENPDYRNGGKKYLWIGQN